MASLDHIEAAPNNPYRILRTWSPKSVLMLHVFVESPSAARNLQVGQEALRTSCLPTACKASAGGGWSGKSCQMLEKDDRLRVP